MSNKETNLREKLKQALSSTIKVISDDLEVKRYKNKDLYKTDSIEINKLNNKYDFIQARAKADSTALKKKFTVQFKLQILICYS